MGRLISSRRAATTVVIALAVIVAGAGAFAWLRAAPLAGAHAGGDPGGRLMASLAPLVRVVPGFEAGRVRWISPPCDSCRFPAMYAMKVEPRWDSCDGRPGTFGWDPVVIQVGFRWAGTTRTLVKLLGNRLAARGWAAGALPSWSDEGIHGWVFPRARAPSETVVVEPPGDEWQVMMEARPEGRLVSGC